MQTEAGMTMNRFVCDGEERYAKVLLAEMARKRQALEKRLAEATTDDERARLHEELQQVTSDYQRQQQDVEHCLF